MLKISLIILFLFVFIAKNVNCDDGEISVDIVCMEDSSQTSCEALFEVKITSLWASIGKVTNSSLAIITTSSIRELKIDNKPVKFMPAGIKKKFLNLNSITITSSVLTHLERDDMRQFGNDLFKLKLSNNELTALQGDIFEFNNNIEEIDLSENPLKFIDHELFKSFKKMFLLTSVLMNNSGCIDQASFSPNPKTFKWNMEKCNNIEANNSNIRRIQNREVFLIKECLDQCTCSNSDSGTCSRSCVDKYCEGTLENKQKRT